MFTLMSPLLQPHAMNTICMRAPPAVLQCIQLHIHRGISAHSRPCSSAGPNGSLPLAMNSPTSHYLWSAGTNVRENYGLQIENYAIADSVQSTIPVQSSPVQSSDCIPQILLRHHSMSRCWGLLTVLCSYGVSCSV